VIEDYGDIGQGFHIVDDGGLAPKATGGRKRRADAWLAPFTHDGLEQCRFFATYECTRAKAYFQIQVIAAAEDVLAEQTGFPAGHNGFFDAFDGQGVFGADVQVALLRTD